MESGSIMEVIRRGPKSIHGHRNPQGGYVDCHLK